MLANDGELSIIPNNIKHKKFKGFKKIEFYDFNKVQTFMTMPLETKCGLKISGWALLYSGLICDYVNKF